MECLTFRKRNFSRHGLLRKYGMLAGHPLRKSNIKILELLEYTCKNYLNIIESINAKPDMLNAKTVFAFSRF
jgi:hypothetical protein